MADTVTLDPGAGGAVIATDDLGATGHVQLVKLVDGTDNGTGRIAGDASNGLDVDVTRLPALPAGTNNIGDVDIASAIPAGSNEIGGVNVTKLAGTAVAVNSGSLSAGVQRVTLATDQVQLTNALKVDGSAVTQPVSGPLTDTQLRATPVPVSGTVTANLGTAAVTNAGTFAVQDSQKLADDAAFTVGTTPLSPVGYLADQTSTDSVNEGDIGAARITLDRKQIVTLAPSADTEGLLVANNIDVDETEDAVKASAGKLYGWFWYNDGATEVYVKYYNDTVANVVVGTTVPFMTIPIPAGSASNIEWSHGIPFSAAITIAATTAATTADTGAPATNQVVGFSLYQ